MASDAQQGPTALDIQELFTRCLNDIDFTERVLSRFQSQCEHDMEDLEQALRAEETETVSRIAHRLKGASANAAAHGLRQRAAVIEQAARQQPITEVSTLFQGLRSEWDRFVKTVPNVLASLETSK
jgi:HPt (histidine-containing phosphotransfer) domain-containing protein